MKGLELSRLFYEEVVKPMLEHNFAELMPRIALNFPSGSSKTSPFEATAR